MKDLAWGLARAGVAALRFDKVTHAHPEQAAARTGFILTDGTELKLVSGIDDHSRLVSFVRPDRTCLSQLTAALSACNRCS